MALVVERPKGEREILAVGCLSKLHNENAGEFALLIPDKWQNQGLGTKLLRLLVQIGRDQNLDSIIATILPNNQVMQHIAQKVGFTLSKVRDSSEIDVELRL